MTDLRIPAAAVGMKLSTEDAGMPFEEIGSYAARFGGRLEIIVKIGGPGARNDVAQSVRLGARTLVAPMVESAYALEDFVAGVDEMLDGAAPPRLGVNIETAGAVEHLDGILGSPAGERLDLVVVGRTDLARSMRLRQDDDAVLDAAARVVGKARALGKGTSVGGGVTPRGARALVERIRPDRVNTRLFVLDPSRGEIGAAVVEAIEAEILLLKDDAERGFVRRDLAERRIADLRRRLEDS